MRLRSRLEQTIPMQANIVLNIVNHRNNNSITFSSYNFRPRKLAVDCHYALLVAQSREFVHLYLQKHGSKCYINPLISCDHLVKIVRRTLKVQCLVFCLAHASSGKRNNALSAKNIAPMEISEGRREKAISQYSLVGKTEE